MSQDQMFFGQSPANQRTGFRTAGGEGGYYVIKYAQDPGGAGEAERMGDGGNEMESTRAGVGRVHAVAPAFTFSRRSRPTWVPLSEQLAAARSPTAATSKVSGKGCKPGAGGLASGLARPSKDFRLQLSPEAARTKRQQHQKPAYGSAAAPMRAPQNAHQQINAQFILRPGHEIEPSDLQVSQESAFGGGRSRPNATTESVEAMNELRDVVDCAQPSSFSRQGAPSAIEREERAKATVSAPKAVLQARPAGAQAQRTAGQQARLQLQVDKLAASYSKAAPLRGTLISPGNRRLGPKTKAAQVRESLAQKCQFQVPTFRQEEHHGWQATNVQPIPSNQGSYNEDESQPAPRRGPSAAQMAEFELLISGQMSNEWLPLPSDSGLMTIRGGAFAGFDDQVGPGIRHEDQIDQNFQQVNRAVNQEGLLELTLRRQALKSEATQRFSQNGTRMRRPLNPTKALGAREAVRSQAGHTQHVPSVAKLSELGYGGASLPKGFGRSGRGQQIKINQSSILANGSVVATEVERRTVQPKQLQTQALSPQNPARTDTRLFGVQGINHFIKRRQSHKAPQRRKNIAVQLSPRHEKRPRPKNDDLNVPLIEEIDLLQYMNYEEGNGAVIAPRGQTHMDSLQPPAPEVSSPLDVGKSEAGFGHGLEAVPQRNVQTSSIGRRRKKYFQPPEVPCLNLDISDVKAPNTIQNKQGHKQDEAVSGGSLSPSPVGRGVRSHDGKCQGTKCLCRPSDSQQFEHHLKIQLELLRARNLQPRAINREKILPGISRGAKDAVEQIVKSQQQNLIDYNNDVFKHMEQLEHYVSQLQAPEGSSRVVSNSSMGESGHHMRPRDANVDTVTEDFGPPGSFSPGSPFHSIRKGGIREAQVTKRERQDSQQFTKQYMLILENFKKSLKLDQATRIDYVNDPELYCRTFLKDQQKKGPKQRNQIYFSLRRQRKKIHKRPEVTSKELVPSQPKPGSEGLKMNATCGSHETQQTERAGSLLDTAGAASGSLDLRTLQLYALYSQEQPPLAVDPFESLYTDRLMPVSLNDNEERRTRYANAMRTKARGKHYMMHYAKRGVPTSPPPHILREGSDLKVVVDGWGPDAQRRQNEMRMRGIWSRSGLESDKASGGSQEKEKERGTVLQHEDDVDEAFDVLDLGDVAEQQQNSSVKSAAETREQEGQTTLPDQQRSTSNSYLQQQAQVRHAYEDTHPYPLQSPAQTPMGSGASSQRDSLPIESEEANAIAQDSEPAERCVEVLRNTFDVLKTLSPLTPGTEAQPQGRQHHPPQLPSALFHPPKRDALSRPIQNLRIEIPAIQDEELESRPLDNGLSSGAGSPKKQDGLQFIYANQAYQQ